MNSTATDRRFMRRALTLARRGWGRTAPNPMVGAVLVRDNGIVGEGWHAEFGGAHAEVAALGVAGDRARGATAYVTLEPCNHAGQTPPCVRALVDAGVVRVVFGASDPNPLAGGGAAALRAAGVTVDAGVDADAARELNAAFHARYSRDRPFVTLKFAVSLDCAIASAAQRTAWITGRRARHAGHKLRAASDAIAIGSGTALADDPQLTVRGVSVPRVQPLRVVFDRRARLSPASRLARTARSTPVLLVTSEPRPAPTAALEALGVEIAEARSLGHALRDLRTRGIHSLLCEGGAGLGGALLAAGLVDRLVMFQAPVVLGAGALQAFAFAPPNPIASAPRWRMLDRTVLGEDTMTLYAPAAD